MMRSLAICQCNPPACGGSVTQELHRELCRPTRGCRNGSRPTSRAAWRPAPELLEHDVAVRGVDLDGALEDAAVGEVGAEGVRAGAERDVREGGLADVDAVDLDPGP